MPLKPFQADIRYANGFAILDLGGEIDSFAEQALKAAYSQATQANPEAVLLNFSQVDYINSTGIALIVGLLAQAREANRRLLTFGLSKHYVEIFQITRLSDYMPIYPDEASALAQAG
jgi:anti-anti-sigma factor